MNCVSVLQNMNPNNVDFSKHPDEFMRSTGNTAYNIISEMNAWDLMKINPPEDKGYMFWGNVTINKIMCEIDRRCPGQSGASIAYIMRHMHYIAVNGWESYYDKFIDSDV